MPIAAELLHQTGRQTAAPDAPVMFVIPAHNDGAVLIRELTSIGVLDALILPMFDPFLALVLAPAGALRGTRFRLPVASPLLPGRLVLGGYGERAQEQNNSGCPHARILSRPASKRPDFLGRRPPPPSGRPGCRILEFMPFASISEAIEEIRAGRMLVVVDDEDRENEGDLTIAAQFVTPEVINFMATHGRGLICLALTPERCDELDLPPAARHNTSRFSTAFCESVDAREGVTTGISAADRARTIQVCIDPRSRPSDLARPGHIFPLRAREGGVLVRAGQTEASVDLARLAGLTPAGVICEIMGPDGTMARVPQLTEYCREHGIKMISVADLIRYRLQHERFIRRIAEGTIQTASGEFHAIAYGTSTDSETHLALVRGDVAGRERVLVRMHSHCLYGDVFGATTCDCGQLVRRSLERIAEEGAGVLVYLHQTGPGLRIDEERIVAHSRDSRLWSSPDGQRLLQYESGIGAQILSDLGLHTVRLLTNHPRRVIGLQAFGIEIVEQTPVALAAVHV